jgi:hypothetical protein
MTVVDVSVYVSTEPKYACKHAIFLWRLFDSLLQDS